MTFELFRRFIGMFLVVLCDKNLFREQDTWSIALKSKTQIFFTFYIARTYERCIWLRQSRCDGIYLSNMRDLNTFLSGYKKKKQSLILLLCQMHVLFTTHMLLLLFMFTVIDFDTIGFTIEKFLSRREAMFPITHIHSMFVSTIVCANTFGVISKTLSFIIGWKIVFLKAHKFIMTTFPAVSTSN